MRTTMTLLALSVLVASTIAGTAEARRLGNGQSVGDAPAVAPAATTPNAGGGGAAAQRPSIPTAGDRAKVVTGAIAAGALASAARISRVDAAQESPAPAAQDPAAAARLAATEARLRRLDLEAERERTGEGASRKAAEKKTAEAASDKSSEKAGDKPADQADKPVVKTAAERRREQQEAAEKATKEREEEARRVKLAREASCRIEPVMTDAALANCRQVWRM